MRALSPAVAAITRSQRFTYYDVALINLPFGPGDIFPPILSVSTAEIEVSPTLDFTEFVYKAFLGAFGRPPLLSESSTWIDDLNAAVAVSVAELKTTAAGLIDALFLDSAYDDRMRNDDQFVTDLYAAFLGRVADKGKAGWVEDVQLHDRETVRNAFKVSIEFNKRIILLAEPAPYESDVRNMGDLTFSDGAAIDGTDFSLTNVENTYSDMLGQPGRRLHPAPTLVNRAFRRDDGSYEAVEMLSAFAKFGDVDGDDAKVALISDLQRPGVDVIQTVPQRCPLIYKGPGCDSPDASPTCSRLKDDAVNGCASKLPAPQIEDVGATDNRASFGGVSKPVTIARTGGEDTGGIGPGGWPIDDYDPFDPRRYRGREPV